MFPIAPTLLAAPAASALGHETLFDYVVAGGPFMWPLAFCSVLALSFIVERFIRLRRGRLGTSGLGDRVIAAVKEGGPKTALEICDRESSALARVLATGLRRADRAASEVEKSVEDAGLREVRKLAANLKPLEVIAVIAPLLGLLGTVVGMILAFSSLALKEGGRGNPELLASGISHALICTASGLLIAVVSQAFYYVFRARIERFVRMLEDVYARLADQLIGKTEPAHAHP